MTDTYYLSPSVYGHLRSLGINDCMGRLTSDFFKIGNIAGWRHPIVLAVMSTAVPEGQAYMAEEVPEAVPST